MGALASFGGVYNARAIRGTALRNRVHGSARWRGLRRAAALPERERCAERAATATRLLERRCAPPEPALAHAGQDCRPQPPPADQRRAIERALCAAAGRQRLSVEAPSASPNEYQRKALRRKRFGRHAVPKESIQPLKRVRGLDAVFREAEGHFANRASQLATPMNIRFGPRAGTVCRVDDAKTKSAPRWGAPSGRPVFRRCGGSSLLTSRADAR